jgi:hypothetical protein
MSDWYLQMHYARMNDPLSITEMEENSRSAERNLKTFTLHKIPPTKHMKWKPIFVSSIFVSSMRRQPESENSNIEFFVARSVDADDLE